jgi:DNA-binding MarR family transcriptional regulator
MDDSCALAALPADGLAAAELAVWGGFVQAHAVLARELDAELRAAHGLPLTDFAILLWLSRGSCERRRMAALADSVLLSPSGLSRAVERLQARGLVRRARCADDRRGAYATLTEAGVALFRAASATHAAVIRRRFLDRLTPEEQRSFAGAWRRVLAGSGCGCLWPHEAADGPAVAAHRREHELEGDEDRP